MENHQLTLTDDGQYHYRIGFAVLRETQLPPRAEYGTYEWEADVLRLFPLIGEHPFREKQLSTKRINREELFLHPERSIERVALKFVGPPEMSEIELNRLNDALRSLKLSNSRWTTQDGKMLQFFAPDYVQFFLDADWVAEARFYFHADTLYFEDPATRKVFRTATVVANGDNERSLRFAADEAWSGTYERRGPPDVPLRMQERYVRFLRRFYALSPVSAGAFRERLLVE